MKYSELKSKLLANPKIKAEYDALEPEYQLIQAMIEGREELNMSQQKLSEITGINRADISKLENGSANPSLKTIKRIAGGLGKRVQIKFV